MSKIINQIISIEDTSNRQLNGYLTISTSETIDIDQIVGSIFFEVRGRMTSQKIEIISFELAKQNRVVANKKTIIPFSFDLSKEKVDSYKGKNVSFSYSIEVRSYVNSADTDKLQRNIFSKLVSFVTADNSLKTSKYFTLESLLSDYQVTEANTKFDFKFNFTILLIIAFLFGGIYMLYIPEFTPIYIGLGVLFLTVSNFLFISYLKNILGDVTMETLRADNAFLCNLKKTGNFNLTDQKIYYEIIEIVEDDRGTSSYTYNAVIYKSEVKKIPDFKDASSLTFQYPKKKGLYSTEVTDASIIWKMNLQGKFHFGLVLKYSSSLVVTRKQA